MSGMGDKLTREGPVERVILEMLEQERQRRGRLYGMRRDEPICLDEWRISSELQSGWPQTHSRRVATRAAMRRFVAKHPNFALHRDAHRHLWLYDTTAPDPFIV